MSTIKKYIGLSLSFCIQDILQGKVAIEDISAIVPSTAFGSISEVMEHYFISYWSKYADEAACIALLKSMNGLVLQPRLSRDACEHRGHMISHGFWLNTETGVLSKHFPDKIKDTISYTFNYSWEYSSEDGDSINSDSDIAVFEFPLNYSESKILEEGEIKCKQKCGYTTMEVNSFYKT